MGFKKEKIQGFPQDPGVYIMKDQTGTILYIGKAKNLRQRIRNYFSGNDTRAIIPHLVSKIEEIETLVVSSEKEALILENNLIKEHQPKYNALLKDDKSAIALKINPKDQWPKLSIVRYRGSPEEKGLYFGPYASALAARETFELILKLFPLRQCSDAEFLRRNRPCLLYQMKKCLAPCARKCSSQEYTDCVHKTIRFLKGQDKEVVRELTREMTQASDALEFEKAGKIADLLKKIEITLEAQHVDTPRGDDADVIGLYGEKGNSVLVLLRFRKGRLSGSKAFDFSGIIQDREDLVSSFLLQRYEPPSEIVQEILLDMPFKDCQLISDILSERYGVKVKVHIPLKGIKRRWVELAQKNAHVHFRAQGRLQIQHEKTLMDMQEVLGLSRFPQKIDCLDISHTAGNQPVATCVTFVDGVKASRGYRTYNIKLGNKGDDYEAMTQVLTRRYKKAQEEMSLPDCVIVDGGKGHLKIALKVFESLNIVGVDVIAIAKESGRHDKGMTQEQIFTSIETKPFLLSAHSPILFLLQNIRDEAHRFAIAFHRKQRSKKILHSALDDVKGIGPVKKRALLTKFGSMKGVLEASDEELLSVKGMTQLLINAIRADHPVLSDLKNNLSCIENS